MPGENGGRGEFCGVNHAKGAEAVKSELRAAETRSGGIGGGSPYKRQSVQISPACEECFSESAGELRGKDHGPEKISGGSLQELTGEARGPLRLRG